MTKRKKKLIKTTKFAVFTTTYSNKNVPHTYANTATLMFQHNRMLTFLDLAFLLIANGLPVVAFATLAVALSPH